MNVKRKPLHVNLSFSVHLLHSHNNQEDPLVGCLESKKKQCFFRLYFIKIKEMLSTRFQEIYFNFIAF